jgi:hypothetical protein
MTTILIKKKDTAGAPAPGDLTNAAGGTEIAVNTATRRIYTKDSGGNVVELGNNATSSTIADLTVTTSTTLSYGTANQVQYLNASKLLVGSANLTFNGTTLTANTIGAFTLGGTIAGGGNQINNVIIGTSTPLAGSFTTLTASTSITNSGLTAGRVTYAGTAGLLQDSANLAFDGTNLGLGGTTNTYGSQTTLTLSGSNVSRIDFRSNSVFTGTILSYQSITEGLRLSTVAGYPITFHPAATEAGRFTAAGNLLIATTSATSAPAPSGGYLLEVAKNQNAFTEVLVKNTDPNSAGQANYTAISDTVTTRFGSAGSGDAYQTPASGFVSVDGAYPLTFRTNSSERVRITSAGNLLVNANSAAAASTYIQASSTSGNGNNAYIGVFTGGSGATSANHNLGIQFGTTVNSIRTTYNGSGVARNDLVFQINSSDVAAFNSAGNFGIGTTSPSVRLDLGSVGNASCFTATNGTDANFSIVFSTDTVTLQNTGGSGKLAFNTGGSERMRLNNSGLGIGFSTPDQPLAFADALGVKMQLNGSNANGYQIALASSVAGGDAMMKFIAGETGAGEIGFYNTSNLRMLINASGNVLVGTASTEGNGKIVTVNNENGIVARTTAPANSYEAIVASRTSTVGKIITLWYDLNLGTQAGFINIDSSSSVSLNNTSDYRVKKNIQPLVNSIQRVKNLKPVSFNFKADGYFAEGFIAHEFAEVIPQAVHGVKDAVDENGKPVYQAIDQSKIVPLLTAALQEQQAIIESLKARLDAANL